MTRQFFLLLFFLTTSGKTVFAQGPKTMYDPCLHKDSVNQKLLFIQQNAKRILVDTFDCRQELMDSIAAPYIYTKEVKYLDALNYIRSSADKQTENLFTDILKRYCENNFSGLLQDFYKGRGKYAALEKELVATMNMIVEGRAYKQKFMGLLQVEISKAKDAKDVGKAYYIEKLRTRIEEEKY